MTIRVWKPKGCFFLFFYNKYVCTFVLINSLHSTHSIEMLYHFYFGEVILNVIGWFLDGLMGFYCFPLLISRLKDIQYYASTLANLQSLYSINFNEQILNLQNSILIKTDTHYKYMMQICKYVVYLLI